MHCRLICLSCSEHLAQIYTGFGMLAEQGAIELVTERSPDMSTDVNWNPVLVVIVNNSWKIVYDTWDGPGLRANLASECDLYFKRSFDPQHLATVANGNKVHPLGLNYVVYGPHDGSYRRLYWAFTKRWGLPSISELKSLVRAIGWLSRCIPMDSPRSEMLVSSYENTPRLNSQPKILFMARTWRPERVSKSPEQALERQEINAMRANVIRSLRREFGSQFYGGFYPDEHAKREFPDCAIDSLKLARKADYLKRMHESDICIATQGLLGSNGWKLAEYVVASKAIVSEGLRYTVTGSFAEGRNYLRFNTADECVAAVVSLQEPNRRLQMMQENHDYYHASLRPDRLVWNSLTTAYNLMTNMTKGEN